MCGIKIYIIPILTYGAEAFYDGPKTPQARINILNIALRVRLRAALLVWKTIPNTVLYKKRKVSFARVLYEERRAAYVIQLHRVYLRGVPYLTVNRARVVIYNSLPTTLKKTWRVPYTRVDF